MIDLMDTTFTFHHTAISGFQTPPIPPTDLRLRAPHQSSMNSVFYGLQYDIPAAAGWFSSISGVLAGFALLSILIPLDHEARKDAEGQTVEAVISFTCAFFSLLVLSFSYAVLSGRIGEGTVQGVAAYEQLLSGSAFGFATLLLLFGLHAILTSYGSNRRIFQPARGMITQVTSTIGPILLLSLQFSSSLDVETYRARTLGESYEFTGWLGLSEGIRTNLWIVLMAIVAVLILAVFGKHLPRVKGIKNLAGKCVLLYTVVKTMFCSFVLPLLPEGVLTAAWLGHGILGMSALAGVMFSATSWMSRYD